MSLTFFACYFLLVLLLEDQKCREAEPHQEQPANIVRIFLLNYSGWIACEIESLSFAGNDEFLAFSSSDSTTVHVFKLDSRTRSRLAFLNVFYTLAASVYLIKYSSLCRLCKF